jgi:hypothetical protein
MGEKMSEIGVFLGVLCKFVKLKKKVFFFLGDPLGKHRERVGVFRGGFKGILGGFW